jgi:rSAM-partnered protein
MPETDESDLTAVSAPRSGETPEWEVFYREETADPLIHAGSVAAPTASLAREQAEQLLGHAASALWLARVGDVNRYAERTLGEEGEAP